MGNSTKTTFRQIAAHDWYWLIKDWLDITLACGRSLSKNQAMADSRAAKADYLRRVAQIERGKNTGRPGQKRAS